MTDYYSRMAPTRLPTPVIVELDKNHIPDQQSNYPDHFQQDVTYHSPPEAATSRKRQYAPPAEEEEETIDPKVRKQGELEEEVDEVIRVEYDPKKALMELEINCLEEEKERRTEELWHMEIKEQRKKLRKAEEEKELKDLKDRRDALKAEVKVLEQKEKEKMKKANGEPVDVDPWGHHRSRDY